MRVHLIAAALLVALVLAGCATGPIASASVAPSAAAPSATAAPELVGTVWRLSAIDGAVPAPGPDVTLRFEAGRVSGDGPCNGFGGALTGDPRIGAFAIGDLISTKRACVDEARTALETAYFAALRSVTTAAWHGPTRLLLAGGGRELAFERVG